MFCNLLSHLILFKKVFVKMARRSQLLSLLFWLVSLLLNIVLPLDVHIKMIYSGIFPLDIGWKILPDRIWRWIIIGILNWLRLRVSFPRVTSGESFAIAFDVTRFRSSPRDVLFLLSTRVTILRVFLNVSKAFMQSTLRLNLSAVVSGGGLSSCFGFWVLQQLSLFLQEGR